MIDIRNAIMAGILPVIGALTFTACSNDPVIEPAPDATPVDCSILTYENFGRAFIEDNCLECHSNTLTGLARKDAPESLNFDDYTLVFGLSAQIKITAGTGSVMPPSFAQNRPMPSERVDLTNWINCNLP